MGLKKIKNTLIKLCSSKFVAYHSTNNYYDFSKMTMPAHFGTYQASLDAGGKYILKAYISISNPVRLYDDSVQVWDTNTTRGTLLNELKIEEKLIQVFENKYGDELGLVKLLQSKGYDSVVYENNYEDIGNDSYIIFENSQITPIEIIEQ